MGQHIVISFVSIAFLDHKNVCLALVLSAIQSDTQFSVFGSHLGRHLDYLCE